jgi:hypothetical protein
MLIAKELSKEWNEAPTYSQAASTRFSRQKRWGMAEYPSTRARSAVYESYYAGYDLCLRYDLLRESCLGCDSSELLRSEG